MSKQEARLSDLSPEQRRVLLAEAAGWTCCGHVSGHEPHGLHPSRSVDDYTASQIIIGDVPMDTLPAFDTDLNAVAELEAKLTDEQHNRFRKHLRAIVVNDLRYYWSDMARRAYVSAPATQRASALLLTFYPEMEP